MSLDLFLLTVAFSIVFTGVYVKTGKNLFSALLLRYAAINTSLSNIPSYRTGIGGNRTAMLYMLIFYIAAAILIVLRKPFCRLGEEKAE